MEKTIEKKFTKGGEGKRGSVQAVLGFQRLGDQEPYFYALASEWNARERAYINCAAHALLRKEFPEHALLVKWHLSAIKSGPMHYEANAVYHAQGAQGRAAFARPDDKPIEWFKATVVWGAVPEADVGEPWTWPDEAVRRWLRERKPALMAKFHAEIEAAFPGMWAQAEAL
jgi:hypothetical protein